MLKNISNLGSVLDKKEQQSINGSRNHSKDDSKHQSLSFESSCSTGNWCPIGQFCKCDDNDCSSGTCVNA